MKELGLMKESGQPAALRDARGAVDRAMAVLEELVASGCDVGLAELASRVRLPKPTVHRILQTLIGRGYARQVSEGLYAPGLRILALAGAVWANVDVGALVRPFMAQLQDLVPETIHFAVLDGAQAVYVEKLEGRRAYRMASVVGMALSLHSTAIGKSMLAFLDDADFGRWAGDAVLTRRTSRTLTTHRQVLSELVTIRRCGYAIDDEENEEDIRCVGAAVLDARNRVFGGISVSAPAFQLTRDNAEQVAPAVATTAARISIAAGLPPHRLPAAYAALLGGPPRLDRQPPSP